MPSAGGSVKAPTAQQPRTSKSNEPQHLLKLVLVGDTGAGKSCLLLRFADDTFTDSYISTIGVDFRFRLINIDNKLARLQVWDTAGQERFRSITSAYYRGAHGVLIVYDATCKESFNAVETWVQQVEQYSDEAVPKVLVACKTDANKEVSTEEGRAKAEALGMDFYETSAKECINVDAPFVGLSAKLLAKIEEQEKARRRTAAASGGATASTRLGAEEEHKNILSKIDCC